MQVILQKTIPSLGLVGDVVNVSPGHYRNFLSPKGVAVLANTNNVKQWEHQKKIIEVKKSQAKKEAQALVERLTQQSYEIEHQAGEKEKLFGSVTAQELVKVLDAAGFKTDKRMIQLDAPIKTLGEHEFSIKLHHDVVAKLKILVKAKVGAESVAEAKKA